MGVQETHHFFISRAAEMIAQQGRGPVFRKENISCALYFLQHLESRTDVFHRLLLAQRMVQITYHGSRPRLYPPVFRYKQAVEQSIEPCGIGYDRP